LLVGFSVKNFRSIAAAQSLNFVASGDRSHELTHCITTRLAAVPRLTRTAALFGPNGSGKSNLLLAFSVMRDFILRSSVFLPSDISNRYMPFNSPDMIGSPTGFGIDVILGRFRYRYKFTFDAQQVISEELRVYASRKSQLWFGREFNTESQEIGWAPFSAAFNGPRERWRRATQPCALFLSTAADMGASQLRPLIEWFSAKLDIKHPSDFANLDPLVRRARDKKFVTSALDVLRSVDVPVTDIRVTDSKIPAIELLYSRHGDQGTWMDLREDSQGMRHLLLLLVPILDGADMGRCVVVDEFDSCLHPLIARFLIGLVQSETATRHGMQFLFVSHDMALLDLELLRRDEVWLVESDQTLATQVLGLASFGPRRHEIVSNSYLRGRFGAVPRISGPRSLS
jgi:uncharacterized protein